MNIITITCRVLGIVESVVPMLTDVELTDDGVSLGFDSLDYLEFIIALEEDFDITISDKEGEKLTTIQSVIDFVDSKLNPISLNY